MLKRIIFVTDLTLWSMGNGNGGPAFTQTINKYIDEGWEVWLVSDVKSNRGFDRLPSNQNIVLSESIYKRFIFKRHIGIIYKFFDHINTTRRFVTTICRILSSKQCTADDTVLYAYEIFGVKACAIISKLTKIPFVTRFQGTVLAQYKDSFVNRIRMYPHFQALSQKADVVIMTDDGTQGDLVLQRLKNNSKRMLFLRNGLELLSLDTEVLLSQFDRRSFRKGINSQMNDKSTMFLTVSRLVGWKHVDRAINAFADYQKSGGDGYLVIVGDGDSKNELEELAKCRNVSERVFFAGAVKHAAVYNYMMACDVFLSLYDLSNVGNPLLEALTLGKCVITLNVGDTGKVIINQKNGVLIDIDDLKDLGAIMGKVSSDISLRDTLGENASIFAKNNLYTWEKRMNLELEAVSSLIEQK